MCPMATQTKTKRSQVRHLPPEPWGAKMRRAREDVAGMSMETAVHELGRYLSASMSTVSRIEHSSELPPQKRTREKAILLCRVYGIDPAELDLDLEDLPEYMRRLVESSVTRRYPVRPDGGLAA